jgi:predicted ribosome quality control (RQC) complex YloA/Tae2 family protein
MKIELSGRKNINDNAAIYYERAKHQKAKSEGARQAIQDTERKLAELDVLIAEKKAALEFKQASVKLRRDKQWYEKFHYFNTSDGFLVNEILVARHMEDDDLFMHADVHGAPATVIRKGQSAPERTLLEAAQFSASYSSAWKGGLGIADVYAVKPGQVSKHSHGQSVPKGGFMLKGERQWFRGVKLGLWIGMRDGIPVAEPEAKEPEDLKVLLHPGGDQEKGAIAKVLAKKFNCEMDDLLQILPSGESRF